MLLVTVLVLSTRWLVAEHHYMLGFQEERDLSVAFAHLERAQEFFPFDYKIRLGSASLAKQVLERAVKHGDRSQ